jgi:hypothetical protein
MLPPVYEAQNIARTFRYVNKKLDQQVKNGEKSCMGMRASKGKRFFFEKKKQKTFGPAGAGTSPATAPRSEVFFASRPARAFLSTKKKAFLA